MFQIQNQRTSSFFLNYFPSHLFHPSSNAGCLCPFALGTLSCPSCKVFSQQLLREDVAFTTIYWMQQEEGRELGKEEEHSLPVRLLAITLLFIPQNSKKLWAQGDGTEMQSRLSSRGGNKKAKTMATELKKPSPLVLSNQISLEEKQ